MDTNKTILMSINKNHIPVLDLMELKGILPDTHFANHTAKSGYINILQWLELRDILPNYYGANMAAEYGHVHILDWLEIRGILPNRLFIYYSSITWSFRCIRMDGYSIHLLKPNKF